MCGDQRTTFETPFSHYHVVPAIELWLLGLAKDAFPTEPSLALLEFYTSYTTTKWVTNRWFLFFSKEEPSITAQMQKGHVGLEADISGPSIATHGHDCSSCSVGIGNWILSSLYVVVFHFHIKVGKMNSYTSIFVSVIWVFLCSHTHLGLLHHLGIDSIIVPHHTPLTFAFNSFFCFEIHFI